MILDVYNKWKRNRLIKAPPRILINPERKMVLFWSAKAGSVFIIKWFLYQMNVLAKAKKHSDWIHDYREKMYETPTYKQAMKDFADKPDEYHIIKLVRNPYTRAVSSYVECLYMLEKDNPAAKQFMTKEGKIPLRAQYSFVEFLDTLMSIDIVNVNIHWRCQRHPAEIENVITVNALVKLETPTDTLNHLEKQLNLKPTEPFKFSASPHHNKKTTSEEQSFLGYTPLDAAVRQNIPPYDCFYNVELEQKVAEIYKEDFERYQYVFD